LKHKENVNDALTLNGDEEDYNIMAKHLCTKINEANDMEQLDVKQMQLDVKQMQFCLLHICDTIYSYINDGHRDVLSYMVVLSRLFNYAYNGGNDVLNQFISKLYSIVNNAADVKNDMNTIKDELYSYIIGTDNNTFWSRIINIGTAITDAANNQVVDIQTRQPYTYTPKQFIEGIHVDLVDTTFEDYDRIKNWGDIFIYMNDEYINNAMKTIKFETNDNHLKVTYEGVEKHLNINSTKFNEFIDSAIKFDPATMHILFPNFCPKPPQPGGGKKPTAYKKTDMRYEYNGRNRIVYVGKRGGKYIQIKNKMIPVSKLN
jgi:hypothetical protein